MKLATYGALHCKTGDTGPARRTSRSQPAPRANVFEAAHPIVFCASEYLRVLVRRNFLTMQTRGMWDENPGGLRVQPEPARARTVKQSKAAEPPPIY